MGQLMPLKLMAGLLIDQLASPTISGAWGVAIVGNFIFPPSRSTPGLRRSPPSNTSSRMPIRGNPVFPPDHTASLASWASLPINYFWEDAHLWEMLPRLFPLLGTHPGCLQPVHYVSPLYLYLFIANIFDLQNVPSKKMGIKIRKKYSWVAYINRYLSR